MANEIPVTDVVNVDITIGDVFTRQRNFGLPIFLTRENTPGILPTDNRVFEYTSITEVANDWNSTDEVYKMAQTAFGQNPQPDAILIGIIFPDDTAPLAGYLQCGQVATSVSKFNLGVNNGEFTIKVDDVYKTVRGLNFTAVNYGNIATDITVGMQNASAGFLAGGAISDEAARLLAFQGVEDGEFKLSVDGAEIEVSQLDFSVAGNLATDVVAIINSGLGNTSGYLIGGNAGATLNTINDGAFNIEVDGITKRLAFLDLTSFSTGDPLVDNPNIANYLVSQIESDSAGFLACAPLETGVDSDTFTALSKADFKVIVDAGSKNLPILDFRTVTSLDDVATTINAGLGATQGFLIGATGVAAANFDGLTGGLSGEFRININTTDYDITVIDFGAGPNDFDSIVLAINSRLATVGAPAICMYDDENLFRFYATTAAGPTSIVLPLVPIPAGTGTDISGAGYLECTAASGAIQVNGTAAIGATCLYDTTETKFVFKSNTTGVLSSVDFITTVDGGPIGGVTDISGSGYLNGVFGEGGGTAVGELALVGAVTCAYDSDDNRFIFTSTTSGDTSYVNYLAPLASDIKNGTDLSGEIYLNGISGSGADRIDGRNGIGAICSYDTDNKRFRIQSNTIGSSSTISWLSDFDEGVGTEIAGAGFLDGLQADGNAIMQPGEDAIDATCSFSTSASTFMFTSGTTGSSSKVSFLQPAMAGSLGTDISGTNVSGETFLNGLLTSGGKIVDGFTVGAIGDELNIIADERNDEYFFAATKDIRANPSESNGKADVQAIADWVLANGTGQFFTTTNDLDVIDSNIDTDIASILKSQSNNRTWVHYSSYPDEYPEVSALARASTVNFSGFKSTITMKFKVLPGITAESVDSDKITALRGKNVNFSAIFRGQSQIMSNGVMASGHYQDEIHLADWLAGSLEDAVAEVLSGPTRVPYTENGVTSIVASMEEVFQIAIYNGGLITPELAGGDIQPAYTITTIPVDEIPIATRSARIYNGISFIAYLASTIHEVRPIQGTLTLPL